MDLGYPYFWKPPFSLRCLSSSMSKTCLPWKNPLQWEWRPSTFCPDGTGTEASAEFGHLAQNVLSLEIHRDCREVSVFIRSKHRTLVNPFMGFSQHCSSLVLVFVDGIFGSSPGIDWNIAPPVAVHQSTPPNFVGRRRFVGMIPWEMGW